MWLWKGFKFSPYDWNKGLCVHACNHLTPKKNLWSAYTSWSQINGSYTYKFVWDYHQTKNWWKEMNTCTCPFIFVEKNFSWELRELRAEALIHTLTRRERKKKQHLFRENLLLWPSEKKKHRLLMPIIADLSEWLRISALTPQFVTKAWIPASGLINPLQVLWVRL